MPAKSNAIANDSPLLRILRFGRLSILCHAIARCVLNLIARCVFYLPVVYFMPRLLKIWAKNNSFWGH